jgi:hypothetical protein
MDETNGAIGNLTQFFVRYDLDNWIKSGHSPDEWDAYLAFYAKMRQLYGEILYEIEFDYEKYRAWLGDRENTGAAQREWAGEIALSPKPRSLESLAADYDKKFPRLRESGEATWLKNRDILPPYIYLPFAVWAKISGALGLKIGTLDEMDLLNFGALTAWRYAKEVYRFDAALAEALIATPMKELRGEALARLSSWCVYVETPRELGMFGFFALLSNDEDGDSLILIYHLFNNSLFAVPNLYLSNGTIDEAIAYLNSIVAKLPEADSAAKEMEWLAGKDNERIAGCLSLLLYINSDAPDIEEREPNASPNYPSPKKTKRGLRLFEANRRRVINVGRTIGEKIRAAIESDRIAHTSGRTVRPHIRRAHWHGFWRGARDGERRYNHKWLFPIAVNIERD